MQGASKPCAVLTGVPGTADEAGDKRLSRARAMDAARRSSHERLLETTQQIIDNQGFTTILMSYLTWLIRLNLKMQKCEKCEFEI